MFNICPEIYYLLIQVYTQHDSQIFSMLFALLPDKQELTYSQFSLQFLELVQSRNGKAIERTVINVISNFQPQLKLKDCFYHLFVNIWKHIKSLGLQVCYNKKTRHNFHGVMNIHQ